MQLVNMQLMSIGGKLSAGMTESIKVDRECGIYVHKADIRDIDELQGEK